MEAQSEVRIGIGATVNIREARDGWYVDLPHEETAGPFDEEYDAVMAARRAYQIKEDNNGIRTR